MNRRFVAFVWLFALLGTALPARAQSAAEAGVAATVGDDPIEVAEAQRMMASILHDRKPAGDLLPLARAQVLEEIVKQRLVLAYARRVGDTPSDEDLAKAKKQLQIRLAAQGRKVIAPANLERGAVWMLVWDRYLAKYCTPQRRETWFQNHHRDLDGTQLVVSHILLRPAGHPPGQAGATEMEDLEKQAASIRAEIVSGKLDFAAAAAKYSAAPSGKQGGRIGKIGRWGPQDEAFSRAAFELKAGEISPPVRSPFGVHLIRCDEVLPGAKKLPDLVGAIDQALAKELLEKISQIERRQTAVKYSDAWPHFKPGTTELAK
jgi:parvulin-like peptidyl-prolyl isomerase